MTRLLLAFVMGLSITISSYGDEWSRFRGPNGSGVAEDAKIPAAWTKDNIAWRTPLTGRGHSSPAVWDDHVYVSSAAEDGTFYAVGLSVADGEVLWSREYSYDALRVHPLNSHASNSPATDGDGVYFLMFGGSRSLAIAIDHNGEERWVRDLGPSATMHGPSQSPIVVDDRLIFSFEHEENSDGLESAWYALDTETGETVWKRDRITGAKASSSTPCIYTTAAGEQSLIFASQAHGITAVNPDDGTIVWEDDSLLPTRVIASPVVADGVILATCGVRGGGLKLVAVRPTADSLEVVHSIEERFIPYITTAIGHDGLIYLFHDRGTITCVDIESGEVVWTDKRRAKFFGSPVIAGDYIYGVDAEGEVVVLRTGRTLEEVAINSLGDGSHATPAIAGDRMFIHTMSHLFCITN